MISGVVEGFYGRPWSDDQRMRLFDWLVESGLNTYSYAPKDDVHHRADWRTGYDASKLAGLERLVRNCGERGLRFVYAIGPGLDIRYSDPGDCRTLRDRFSQLIDIGIRDFALLFDDIPDSMHAEDKERFASFAAGQSAVANQLYQWVGTQQSGAGFLFCPTSYCGRMDSEQLGGPGYLDEIGASLDPGIEVFWTGPEIVSREISADHAATITGRLQRKPVIWDNLHANDYDMRRIYTGPYSGRPTDPSKHFSGVLMNPNCEFEANYVPIRTLGDYFSGEPSDSARLAYEKALADWRRAFYGTGGSTWTADDVRVLGDVFYLPDQQGESMRQLAEDAEMLVSEPVEGWAGIEGRFRKKYEQVARIAVQLTELENRDLFYTFNRQWWDLREEMQLILHYVDWKKAGCPGDGFRSPEHHLHTFRGGLVNRLQRLLVMDGQGVIHKGETR